MKCGIETALAALDRGHVTWDQLHPKVRRQLVLHGYSEVDPWGTEPSADRVVLKTGDRNRGGGSGGLWFSARRRMSKAGK